MEILPEMRGEDGWQERKIGMIFKLMKILLKAEKWVVKRMDNDSLEYEDCNYAIKKHEKELLRIERESKL